MREIKFRAWHNNYMTYDHGYNLNISGEVYYQVRSGEYAGEWNQDTEGKVKLMQYTGLKDKNGKEIYEGDIVKLACDNFDDEKTGHEIVFGYHSIGQDDYGIEHKTACFCVKFKDGSGFYGIPSECIVIGNRYENVELYAN